MSWQICASSATGTSHIASGTPCQDRSIHKSVSTAWGDYEVIVISDGCGSARHSDVGSLIVTSEVSECLEYWLKTSTSPPILNELVEYSLGHAHQSLIATSLKYGSRVCEFAATCICLVISPNGFSAAQVGDGIIIGCSKGVCGCIFWHEQEYANVTDSLTALNWREKLQVQSSMTSHLLIDSWFLATDGIQAISCDYSRKVPFAGLVPVLIERLRASSLKADVDIQQAMQSFLNSEKVVSSVTDDRTLAIAFSK